MNNPYDALSPEAYVALGWTLEKLEKWLVTRENYEEFFNTDLIELLHRVEPCVCVEGNPSQKRPNDDLANFLRAILQHRGVNADREIAHLVATHREDYVRRNRVTFAEQPLSHRQITRIPRTVRWGGLKHQCNPGLWSNDDEQDFWLSACGLSSPSPAINAGRSTRNENKCLRSIQKY